MTNRWGNDDHGPGGDPSWLGGTDRDAAAEHSAPVFGGSEEQGPLPSRGDAGSPWRAAFTGEDSERSGSRGPNRHQVLSTVLRLVVSAVILIVFLKMFFGGGSSFGGGFFTWWILLILGVPLLKMLLNMLRKGR